MAVTVSYDWDFDAPFDPDGLVSSGDVADLSGGGFVVIGDVGGHIEGAGYNAAGAHIFGWTTGVGTNGAVDQLSNGNLVIVSQDADSVRYEIRDGAGAIVLANIDIGNTNATNADVAVLPNGFWVASEDRIGATNSDIVVSRYNNAGALLGSFTVDATTANDKGVALTALDGGGVAMAWTRTAGNGATSMYYAIYDDNGGVVVGPTLVDNVGITNRNVSITATNGGGFAIAYEDNDWTNTVDITLVTFTAGGSVLGGFNVSNPTLLPDGSQDLSPSLTRLENGMLALAYSNNAAADTDTILRLIDPATGQILATENVLAGHPQSNDVEHPAIVGVGSSGLALIQTNLTSGAADADLIQAVRQTTGDAAANVISGDGLVDVVNAGDSNDTVNGNGGNDVLSGDAGDDTIDGGAGADKMTGGIGNDTFFVDSVNDQVFENAGEGTGDAVLVTVSGYTLAANVEVGAISTTAALTLTGNSLDNLLVGNTGNDTLNGGDGNDTLAGLAGGDTMAGGLGNDTYRVESLSDVVVENPGEGTGDAVLAQVNNYTLAANVEIGAIRLSADTTLSGNGLDNQLYGAAGNDTLNGAGGNDTIGGGLGNDHMNGGVGDDTYYVEQAGDVVTENPGEGTGDAVIVFTSSYTLEANIEVASRFLTSAYTLTGNELDNRLYGNAGDDIINGGDGNDTIAGGAGNDTMSGGAGNDTYFVEQAGDTVVENPGEGTGDAVITLINSYTLGANVEVLATFVATGASLTGNELNNRIYGNAGADLLNGADGNDVMDGGAGSDTMTGGTGNDVFQFVAGAGNGDHIVDFSGNGAAAGDALQFYGYGTLAQGASFHQIDATHWQIDSANGLIHDIIIFDNAASLDPTDWGFFS